MRHANFTIVGYTPKVWRFAGVAPDGSTFEGSSFAKNAISEGAEVVVEKRRGSRDVLRAGGATLAPFRTSTMLYTTIPFLILVAVYVSRKLKSLRLNARRLLPLLINGEPTFGVFVGSRDTGRRIGDKERRAIVYEVAFRFRANDGLYYETTAETTTPYEWSNARTKLVFYDSENPKDAVLMDAISMGMKFKDGRRFVASTPSTIRSAIFVGVALAGFVATCYFGSWFERAKFSVGSQPAAVAETQETQELQETQQTQETQTKQE